MIKVTALYRWREGATFNHDYYHGEHMRIARAALQPLGLLRLESDRVLYPGDPRPGQVVALTNAFFSDLKQAQTAAKQTAAALMADDPRRHQMLPLDARRALRVLAWLVAAALQVDPIAVVAAAAVELHRLLGIERPGDLLGFGEGAWRFGERW